MEEDLKANVSNDHTLENYHLHCAREQRITRLTTEQKILGLIPGWFDMCRLFSGQWRYTPLIPALGKKRQADLCEFEANLSTKGVPEQAPKLHRKTLS